MVYCSVHGCPNNTRNYSKAKDKPPSKFRFFRFPDNNEIAQRWKVICQKPADYNTKNARVCETHFTPGDYVRNLRHELLKYSPPLFRRLKDDAVPTLNLSTLKTNVDTPSESRQLRLEENCNSEPTNESGDLINMSKVKVSTKIFPGKSKENDIKPTASCSTENTDFEDLLNECLLKNETATESNGKTKTMSIIADNLECSSSESLTGEATNNQNIFSTDFTYKNPLFLQKRIDKYEDDLKKVIDEVIQLHTKLRAQKEKTKVAKKRKVKQMVEFHEIYDNPKMKIPKLIFEQFMTDYDKNDECPEELKQFAAEVNSRSTDSYIFLRESFGNIFPPPDELPECSKEIRPGDFNKFDEDDDMSADAEDRGLDEEVTNQEDPENDPDYLDDDESEED